MARARTWAFSPCGPNRCRISTACSPAGPNQCGVFVSNSATSPGRSVSSCSPRMSRRSPARTYSHSYPAWVTRLGSRRPEDLLEHLHRPGVTGQRDDDAALPVSPGFEVYAGITRRRRADELVQGHPVRLRQGQQQVERRAALAGLEPGQPADGDAGLGGQRLEGQPPPPAQARSRGPMSLMSCSTSASTPPFCSLRKFSAVAAGSPVTIAAWKPCCGTHRSRPGTAGWCSASAR